MKVKEQFEQEN